MNQQDQTEQPTPPESPLETSSRHLAAIFDSLDVAIISSDLNGGITSWNAGAERMYGYDRREMIGRGSITSIVSPEDLEDLTHLYEQVAQGRSFSGREAVHIARDGRRFTARFFMTPLRSTTGTIIGVVAVACDLSGHMESGRQLLDQAGALQGISDAVIVTDMSYRVRSWNRAAEQIYGWPADEVIGRRIETVVATEFGEEQREEVRRDFETQGHWNGEVVQRHRGGNPINVLASITIQRDDADRPLGIIAVNRDITLRRQLEQEIIRVSQYEQQRIGRDLHDGLGSLLSGLSMMSRSFVSRTRQGGAISPEELEELTSLLARGTEQARVVARNLNPIWRDRLGDALQELADNTRLLSGIPCFLRVDPDVRHLHGDVATHLYWITQEGVNNAVKHSRATEISISLSYNPAEEQLLLRVADDGIGISLSEQERNEAAGMGLHIMQYRAGMIGGTLSISSPPDGGTLVSCALRLSRASLTSGTTERENDETNTDSR